jgi:hypothetical protein
MNRLTIVWLALAVPTVAGIGEPQSRLLSGARVHASVQASMPSTIGLAHGAGHFAESAAARSPKAGARMYTGEAANGRECSAGF